jgi:hypothetical protein
MMLTLLYLLCFLLLLAKGEKKIIYFFANKLHVGLHLPPLHHPLPSSPITQVFPCPGFA